MQTILGANGVIARELSRALSASTSRIRQVSRSPQRVNATDEVFAADLLDQKAVMQAIVGSRTVYLVAGLKYNTHVWQEQWPRIMQNVITACIQQECRLVFFDNIYAYGRVDGAMTEHTPFNPCSQKGEVRAKIATMLLDEMRRDNLQAMIVRSADFYGPGATLSFPHAAVFERLKNGKKPQWIGNPKIVHTFSYTPDAGHALAALGLSDDAYGQTWHVPTTPEMLTGEGFVRLACEATGHPYRLQAAPRWLLQAMGLFMPIIRENHEMMYQFEHSYHFDSSKIEAVFGLRATPYAVGITASLRH